MSDLIVVMFEKVEEAEEARESIRKLEKLGKVSLADAEIVSKDENGNIQRHGQTDSGTKYGALGGGMLGLLHGGQPGQQRGQPVLWLRPGRKYRGASLLYLDKFWQYRAHRKL